MIERIELSNVATFQEAKTFEPNKINYLFGGNGTGKTTLGKVINDCDSYSECSLNWSSIPIKPVVYNRDFVEKNFSQSDSIKGIFTLGKDSTDARKKIEKAQKEIDELVEDISEIDEQIENREVDFKEKQEKFVEKAWNIKEDYIDYFKPVYRGYLGSKKSFFEKCLKEVENKSNLLSEDDIIEKCDQVFSESITSYDKFEIPTFTKLIELQDSPILKEKIIGKEDLEIGELIKKLNNSDWVKRGLGYLDNTDNVCPFCQQDISETLKSEIEDFFDETYQDKISKIKTIRDQYDRLRNKLIENIDQILKQDVPILELSELSEKVELFKTKSKSNLKAIEEKVNNPSIPISVDSISKVSTNISDLLKKFNQSIDDHNQVVANIDREKKKLKSQVWRFLVERLKIDLKTYREEKEAYNKAIAGLSKSFEEKQKRRKKLEESIEDLESDITSVQHSVNEINKLLKSFGFTNFKLRKAEKKGFYELVRNDGRKVGKTLSEGEYTFITFLYFYHLLKGSTEETGVTKNKVVVIDDPISSLDSSVLFVVSNLIKSIARDARKDKNGIKQIFILTHNVYFFKEVTFRGSRGQKWREESYWLIRKYNDQSHIIEHEENPIKTTYELLWRELDEPEKINTATVFNTMRRILEYYFNILGGLEYEKAIDKFDGEEKIICKSLIGWINDGSHFINDDLAVTVDPSDIEKYLKVFKDIFYKMDHGSHYEMMMKKEAISD